MPNGFLEILAPAGDEEMLRAAVYSGADSVYLGVQGFNARRGAKNFDAQALQSAVAFCHARGCGVYAALNTVAHPAEQQALRSAVQGVAGAGCDAIIVQDMATALAVQRYAPNLPLHASTQMSVHSLEGVLQLAQLGFTRAILSRELSAPEIAAIAAQSPIELEIFVHGALCVCVSGQCYMSAFLGGRSANRGACAGPCRLPFSATGTAGKAAQQGQHHLSLKDLSVLEALPRLAAMGVASAKIEGRLRGPEYCAVVVEAARQAREGQPYNRKLLADVFSRSGFTDGWLAGQPGRQMFGTRTEANTAALKKALPAARELYRRERPRVAVQMQLCLQPNGATLHVYDEAGNTASATSNASLQPAQRDTEEALRRALEKTGGTPFFVRNILLETNGLFFAGSEANALRRQALDALLARRAAVSPLPVQAAVTLPLPQMAEQIYANKAVPLPATPALRARFASVAQVPQQAAAVCSALLLPLAQWQQVPESWRNKTWLSLPRALFGEQEQQAAAMVTQAATQGFAGFEVHNLSHLHLCKGQPMLGGFGLNITNADALALYAAQGCTAATLSVELTLAEVKQIYNVLPGVPLDLLVYGHLPLMLTRAAPLANAGVKYGATHAGTLTDRRGRQFTVAGQNGVDEIFNPVPLWLAERLPGLPVHTATLYFTSEKQQQAQGILQAFLQQQPAPFEFTRGLYDKGTV